MSRIPPKGGKPTPPKKEAKPKFSAPMLEIKGNELVIVNSKSAE